MPKKKGTKGGSLLQITTEEEYNGILLFLKNPRTKKEDEELKDLFTKIGKYNRKSLKRKASKCTVHQMKGEQAEGTWPRGHKVLIVTTEEENHFIGKVYVPPWHKETIFDRFHGAEGEAGHFGGKKLHKKVNLLIFFSKKLDITRTLWNYRTRMSGNSQSMLNLSSKHHLLTLILREEVAESTQGGGPSNHCSKKQENAWLLI